MQAQVQLSERITRVIKLTTLLRQVKFPHVYEVLAAAA
jgi:hypothetical protein